MSDRTLQKILHVDDEPDIREITKLALVDVGGFNVRSCASGKEALAAAPDFGPDLILIDVMMPGMDGPATLRELRNLPGTAATPAIFMTAKVQAREVEEFRMIGAADVIAKPFDPMKLADQVRAAWAAAMA